MKTRRSRHHIEPKGGVATLDFGESRFVECRGGMQVGMSGMKGRESESGQWLHGVSSMK
ncbi:MAG: hypothetical protein PUC35_08865 [Prevotellaceae bacterium]|nr:hypothetical protein [Prevotellaceae bacterium]